MGKSELSFIHSSNCDLNIYFIYILPLTVRLVEMAKRKIKIIIFLIKGEKTIPKANERPIDYAG